MLALALGGQTIQELKASMTRREFLSWVEFYRLHPFDDLHRYQRPAAMVASAFGGGDIVDRLLWLEDSQQAHDYTDADMTTLKAFGFKPPVKG